ncbi:Lachesin [Gryllus bimaculatus]|nr:Lachesin [Gryllus bimaculatus]
MHVFEAAGRDVMELSRDKVVMKAEFDNCGRKPRKRKRCEEHMYGMTGELTVDGITEVSWIRRKDYHLLTVGVTTYTRDARYEMVHGQHSDEWTLKIKYVQNKDAGLYECQVSSHPPTSNFIELRVVEARAEIAGSAEKYLKVGSSLRLECALRQSTAPPLYIFWYHNNRMINYDSGVNVTTDKEAKTSTLHIGAAQRADSGNYSCVPNNAQPASTYVHILNAGENPAAMQHGLHGLAWLRCPSSWLLLGCVLLSACGGVGGGIGGGAALRPRPPRRRSSGP